MIYQVCEPLYSANYLANKKVVVNQGGTSSAKTYTIMQILHYRAAHEPGLVITVVGQDIPNLKKGAIRDSQRIVASSPYLQRSLINYKQTKGYNKTERIHEYKNGSIIEFTSYDNEQDAKSGKRDYLFINEANGIAYEIYWQLFIRTRRTVYIDYNPTAKFWCHEKVIAQSNCQLIISDHRHNKFLTQEQHDLIENIDDPELWKVYARGRTGKIHGLIYDFAQIDQMPGFGKVVYGLDFGFNHKTALVQIEHDADRLFWDEQIYQSEVTISDLISMMKELNIGRKPIYADHAAADKIEDLKRAGFNVYKADKDVTNGIDFIKRKKLYITKNSTGIIKELRSYKWKIDKVTGEPTDQPVKFMDDAMDAGRYGSYTGFRKSKGIIISNSDSDYLDWIDVNVS